MESKENARLTEIKISPRSPFSFGFGELWSQRELLFFFAWKEIKIKYKQAFLGILWTLIQPVLMMFLFMMLLSEGLGITTGNLPAPLYYMSGLLYWNLFSHTLSHASQSMIANSDIIKKVYFPRLVIPLSSLIVSTVDFAMGIMLLLSVIAYYAFMGDIQFSLFYFLTTTLYGYILAALTSFGLGTLLASINVKYRDVRYIIPFLIQISFFVTPVMYDHMLLESGLVYDIIQWNPLNASIGLIRDGIHPVEDTHIFIRSLQFIPFIAGLIFLSIYVFRRTESYFADIV